MHLFRGPLCGLSRPPASRLLVSFSLLAVAAGAGAQGTPIQVTLGSPNRATIMEGDHGAGIPLSRDSTPAGLHHMVVALAVGGTATLGQDYKLVATDAAGRPYLLAEPRVLMVPSQEQYTLGVYACRDSLAEGDETVTIDVEHVEPVGSRSPVTWSGGPVTVTIAAEAAAVDDDYGFCESGGDGGDGDGGGGNDDPGPVGSGDDDGPAGGGDDDGPVGGGDDDDGGDGNDNDDGNDGDNDDGDGNGGGDGDGGGGNDGGDDDGDTYVAPYWKGTGGFTVRPVDGRSARVRLECGGSVFSSEEYAGEDGLIARAVTRSMCLDEDGRPLHGELTFQGIDDDGWYWVNGDWNVALSPLVRESSLNSRLSPPVPAGVTASPSGDRLFTLSINRRNFGTLMTHDGTGFMAIVPHLVDMEGGGEHVAPYWMGHGGVVGRPLDGNAATFRLSCEDGREQVHTLEAGEDGLVVSLLPGCFDDAGDPIGGELLADGLEDGAWYWINSGRVFRGESTEPARRRCTPGACSTAAPFVRRNPDPDRLTVPVVPLGVGADAGPMGTFLSHGSLIGIVPRIEAPDSR